MPQSSILVLIGIFLLMMNEVFATNYILSPHFMHETPL